MNNYRYILFDMDGTLVDSAAGVTNAVAYALRHFGIAVDNPAQLNAFVGLPIKDAFMEYYGFPEEKAAAALSKYREKFTVEGLHQNKPFPGIRDLLARLKGAGYELLVATCKPEPFARIILDRHGLMSYISMLAGAEFTSGRQHKSDVLEHALHKRGIVQRDRAVVVGDRKYDIRAARQCGVDAVGVLWGYGSREELEEAGADKLAADIPELGAILGAG